MLGRTLVVSLSQQDGCWSDHQETAYGRNLPNKSCAGKVSNSLHHYNFLRKIYSYASSNEDAGPAFLGLVTLLTPALFPQCLWSRKTVARPSFSITENLQVVPKHLRKCCQTFNFQLMKCCLWYRKKQPIVDKASPFVVEILST